MTSELPEFGDFDAFLAALADRVPLVVAPHGTVNTGVLMGGQRQTVSAPAEDGTGTGPMRQGPVRARHLKTARRRFVPPPCFDDALAAFDSGILVLLGDPGTGRETHALNLLAHGTEDPVLLQVDGAVNLARWKPRAQGVHGYLVMEPPEPLALRAWDLSRLEAPLAEAGARLVVVLADAPGLAGALEDHLGVPVVRHRPPDPRKVFAAHLSDSCPDETARTRWLQALEPALLDELLPEGLPPRHAAQAAEAVVRLGVVGGASGAEVLSHLAQAEALEVVARAQAEPVLLAHLLATSVYGGLHHSVVTERAKDLSRLAGQGEQDLVVQSARENREGGTPRSRPLSESLRLLGARRVRCAGEEASDTVSFLWPFVSEAVWEILCRDHPDLVPLLHTWLAGPGHEAEQIERAGRAVAAMALATGGRSLQLLHDLASAPSPAAPQVAAWCLATAAREPEVSSIAADLLEQWSVATEAPLRNAVAYACESVRGPIPEKQALRLLQRLMDTLTDDLSAMAIIEAALIQRFAAGDSATRATVVRRMRDWAEPEDIPSLLTALVFPEMVSKDLQWWSEQLHADAELASSTVRLTGHALNEAVAFVAMRDALLAWCSAADGEQHRAKVLNELLDGLVAARQPGFLRWLLAVERGPDTMPGKEPAARALAVWRSAAPVPNTD